MGTSKLLACLLIATIAAKELLFVHSAAAFPAYFTKFRKTRLPFASCPNDASRTVNQLGLQNQVHDSFGHGGTTATVRAYILCVERPDGPCNRPGATVVFMAAGDNEPDARALLQKMDSTFGDAVLFDCG